MIKRPTLPASGGPGATASSRLGAEGTPSRHDGRGFLPVPSPPTPPPVVGLRQLLGCTWLQGRKVAGCCIWRLVQRLWYVRSALAAGEACRRPCQPAAAAYPHLPLRPSEKRLSGRETGSVREGQSEARLTIWRAPLTKRPAPLAPHGPGTTACSRLAPVRTLSAVERRYSSPQLSRAPRRRTYVT